MPYRVGERTVLFGARRLEDDAPDDVQVSHPRGDTAPMRFALAELRGPLEPFGVVELWAPLPEHDGRALCFDPSHAGGGIDPVGVVQTVRRLAYRASQAARPTT